MKVKCGNCGEVFEYEENKKVCPKCKQFCTLPKEKENKAPINKKIKEKNKVEPESEKKETIQTETIDLSDVAEKRKSKKNFYIIITLFLAIIILPISMGLFSDPSEKINGPDGTIVSTETRRIILSEVYNDVFYVEKIGYTNSGNLYVMYESNIYGFADCGYEINFSVTDVEGNVIPLGCLRSSYAVLKDETESYVTKAIFNYTKDNNRIISFNVTVKDIVEVLEPITYNFKL